MSANRPAARLEGLFKADSGVHSVQDVRRVLKENGYDVENMYQEFEMSDPYINTWVDVSKRTETVTLHSHTFYEILCCQCDGLQYLMGAERYQIRRGDVVVIPPNVSHMPLLQFGGTDPYMRYVLWVSQRFETAFEQVFPSVELLPKVPCVHRPDEAAREEIARLFRKGVDEGERCDEGWQVALAGNTVVLLNELARVRSHQEVVLSSDGQGLLDTIVRYIEDNMAGRISLQTAARELRVSESRISRVLRERMNTTFHQLLTQRRLVAAKTLLQRGEGSEATALAVGFGDYSSFYRAFKREYGISPSAYRSRMRG